MRAKFLELGIIYNSERLQTVIRSICYDKFQNIFWILTDEGIVTGVDKNNYKVLYRFMFMADTLRVLKKNVIVVKSEERLILLNYSGEIFCEMKCNQNDNVDVSNDLIVITNKDTNTIKLYDKQLVLKWIKVFSKSEVIHLGNAAFDGEKLILCDKYGHTVLFLDSFGNEIFRIGTHKKPGNSNSLLCGPHCIKTIKDNETFLICDTLNQRVIEVDISGRIIWSYGRQGAIGGYDDLLWYPSYAEVVGKDQVLIHDSKNNRAVLINRNEKTVIKEFSTPIIKEAILKLPRSVQFLGQERYLVSDTYNNRLVIINRNNKIVADISGNFVNGKLKCPRNASFKNGYIWVSDSGNNRLVKMDLHGNMFEEITQIKSSYNNIDIDDPHEVFELQDNQLLIVNTGQNNIMILDKYRKLIWKYDDLNDPHKAYCENGNMWISDSGNNRILKVNIGTKKTHSINSLNNINLNYPRFYSLSHKYSICINGNDDKRELILKSKINKKTEVISKITSTIDHLCHARWATFQQGSKLIISDTGNNRILIEE